MFQEKNTLRLFGLLEEVTGQRKLLSFPLY